MVIFPGEEVRLYVSQFLSKRGYLTCEIANIKEALRKLSAYKHILAIIDKNIEKEAAGFIDKLRSRSSQVIMLETPFASEFLEAQVIQAIQKWPEQSRPLL